MNDMYKYLYQNNLHPMLVRLTCLILFGALFQNAKSSHDTVPIKIERKNILKILPIFNDKPANEIKEISLIAQRMIKNFNNDGAFMKIQNKSNKVFEESLEHLKIIVQEAIAKNKFKKKAIQKTLEIFSFILTKDAYLILKNSVNNIRGDIDISKFKDENHVTAHFIDAFYYYLVENEYCSNFSYFKDIYKSLRISYDEFVKNTENLEEKNNIQKLNFILKVIDSYLLLINLYNEILQICNTKICMIKSYKEIVDYSDNLIELSRSLVIFWKIEILKNSINDLFYLKDNVSDSSCLIPSIRKISLFNNFDGYINKIDNMSYKITDKTVINISKYDVSTINSIHKILCELICQFFNSKLNSSYTSVHQYIPTVVSTDNNKIEIISERIVPFEIIDVEKLSNQKYDVFYYLKTLIKTIQIAEEYNIDLLDSDIKFLCTSRGVDGCKSNYIVYSIGAFNMLSKKHLNNNLTFYINELEAICNKTSKNFPFTAENIGLLKKHLQKCKLHAVKEHDSELWLSEINKSIFSV